MERRGVKTEEDMRGWRGEEERDEEERGGEERNGAGWRGDEKI